MSATDSIVAVGYTTDGTNTIGNNTHENWTVTGFPASQAWTNAPPPFIPCRNPENLISEKTAKTVDLVLYGIAYPVFALIGITTNVLSMAVFSRQGLRDRINLCLFSLAFADMGFLLFITVGKIYPLVELIDRTAGSYWQQRHRSTVFGALLGFLNVSNAMTTVIALERCICIVAPFKAKTLLKTKYMVILIISVYVYVLGSCFLMNTKYETVRVEEPATNESKPFVYYVSRTSSFYLRNEVIMDILYYDLIAIAIPAISVVVVIISTSITVYKLRVSLSWHRHSNAGQATSAEQREAAVTTMLVAVCCVYVICMTPSVTFATVRKLMPDVLPSGRYCNTFKVTVALVHTLEMVNSSANFFIYYTRGSFFRATLSQLCPCARQEVTSKRKLNDPNTKTTFLSETDY